MINFVIQELKKYFSNLGYSYAHANDIDEQTIVFDQLNILPTHPSRSEKETFYIQDFPLLVLRPHTTGADIHILNKLKGRGKFFTYGLVYRRDDDSQHLPSFHQLDILNNNVEEVSVNSLHELVTGAIQYLFKRTSIIFAAKNIASPILRFRPHFFPYTSPSFELDIQCSCNDKCDFCTNGWLEVLGCGILNVSVSPKHTCLAAGFGIERLAMILNNFFSDNKIFNMKNMVY